jgi:HK97 family phage prohead protease
MKKDKKFLDIEVKAVEGERSLWFNASTEDRDRDGDVLVAKGWKLQNFKKNPVFLWAHDYRRPPIGKAAEAVVEDNKLQIKVEFVPADVDAFAEQVYQLYKQGFMKTVSVGFMAYKVEELTEDDKKQRPEMQWGRRMSAELLELSAVPVPANPMALMQRGFADVMAKGLSINEPEAPPQLHPALKIIGADGMVSQPMVRAAMAALLGARGGIAGLSSEQMQHQAHLVRIVAMDKGIDLPSVTSESTQEELREAFKDVWGNELLDILSEPEPAPLDQVTPEQMKAVGAVLEGMMKNLDAVKAVLK